MTKQCVQLSLLIALAGCSQQAVDAHGPFEGVWIFEAARDVDPSGSETSSLIRASQVIFAEHHYSIIWRVGGDANPPFSVIWQPTDAEKVESFNALRGNAGTYEIADSVLTIHPVVARGDVMGGYEMATFRVVADTLWLTMTDLVAADGTRHQFFADGGRIELRLLRVAE